MPAPAPGQSVFVLQNVEPLPAFGGRIDVIRGEGPVVGGLVKGKPYSARSITESTQTLADGNRIVQRHEVVIHRDSEGRTRREQTLGGVGPWHADKPVTMINIHDPVADKAYVLDPDARTARELRPFRIDVDEVRAFAAAVGPGVGERAVPGVPAPPPAPGGDVTTAVMVQRGSGPTTAQVFSRGTLALPPIAATALGAHEPAQDLGEQVLEGLLVKGTRLVDTIPAGAMGNERPIEIVTERWYSPDIDALVLQRFSDPRLGETTYRLVNVARGEQPLDLFQVPQDYELTVDEPPNVGVRPFGLRRFGTSGGADVEWEAEIVAEPLPQQ
jgi:hypothetical protein